MSHNYGWNADDYEMLQILFEQGLTNDEIGQMMSRSQSNIGETLRRRGLRRGAKECLHCAKPLADPSRGKKPIYCSRECGVEYRFKQGSAPTTNALPIADAQPTCGVCRQALTAEQIARRSAKGLSLEWCSGICKQQAGAARLAS